MEGTRKIISPFCLSILLIFGSADIVPAQEKNITKSFIPFRLEKDFDINTDLKHPAWLLAVPLCIEYEIQPDEAAVAPVETKVKVLYTAHHLYIAFIAKDPYPQRIRAQITERDELYDNDNVGVFLDTYGANQEAYEFFVNPMGVQMDAYRSANGENESFDAVWYSEGVVTDTGYVVVMKIPFKSLNFPDRKVQDWRVQFYRNYPRNARYQFSWTDVSIGNPCLLCQSGTMENVTNIKGGGAFELLPYVVAYQTNELRDPGDLSSGLDAGPIRLRVGGGISYDITSSTSLNAVVNPDFSQIETDADQISINESFALFYPEKRPFFLRDASLFETPGNFYYSRTINNPLAAAKFTHQSEQFSIGLVSAYDENTPFIIPGQFESDFVASSINSYVNIIRGKYNFGPESFVGGLITTRNHKGGSNYAGSVDWKVKLVNHYYLSGQLGYSMIDEINDTNLFNDQRKFGESRYDAALNGEEFDGTLVSLEFEREAKHFEFEIRYESKSPTFQTQTGFINETNTREVSMEQRYAYYPAKKWLSQGDVSVFAGLNYDFYGQIIERYTMVGLSNQFAGQTHLTIRYLLVNDERFRGHFFTGVHRWMLDLNSDPLEELEFGIDVDFGKYIYRTDDPEVGKGYRIEGSVTLRPTSRLHLNFSYDYSKLSSLNRSEEFFSGNILRLEGNYNFSRELSFRLISQYNSFDEQIQIYPLLHYKLNPFTKFYLGMTDYLEQLPGMDRLRSYRETNRQFFVKGQYLLQW